MKTVAISQRVDAYPDRGEVRDALDQKLANLISMAGFLPLPVPNEIAMCKRSDAKELSGLKVWLSEIKPNVILLSGGNNVGDCKPRDATETGLCEFAELNRLPVLGICRGMQMMGVLDGGTMTSVEGHVLSQHKLSGEIVGTVNSYHDYSLAECPKSYRPLAFSEDGELEAMRHCQLPWEGWMWHPEREDEFQARDIDRMRELFKS